MATNIAYLPLIQGADEVGDNEDWRTSIAFMTAGTAAGYPSQTNIGNASVGAVTVTTGAAVGTANLEVTSINGGTASYAVTDPNGVTLGFGLAGIPFQGGGLNFTVNPGNVPLQVGDSFAIQVLAVPLDLTGITFSMQVRTLATAALIYVDANTDNGLLLNGGATGVVAINIPVSQRNIPAGTYGYDILASGDGIVRRCVTASLNIVTGFTQASQS